MSDHGPAFGQAVGDILTYPEKFDPNQVKKVEENIIKNSTPYPNVKKTKKKKKNK